LLLERETVLLREGSGDGLLPLEGLAEFGFPEGDLVLFAVGFTGGGGFGLGSGED
jgi:hypothetical protein